MLRPLIFSALSVALLALFGCEVCPYIASLGQATMAVLFAVFFGIALLLRTPVERYWVLRASPLAQPGRQFALDLGMFVAVGVALTAYDRVVYGFPVLSGMKALLGALTMGLFFAADGALVRSRKIAQQLQQGAATGAGIPRPLSIVRKFAIVGLGILVMLAVDIAFLVLQDVQQVFDGGAATTVKRDVLIESAVMIAFFVPLSINLIVGFARNLRLSLENQRRGLEAVTEGNLDARIAVTSADEFGVIAAHTNRMIGALQERERMRDLFGKLVSPAIGQRLLSDGALALGGSRRRAVILFSDIRDFTRRSESATPEAVVADLNHYFGRMVEIVHAHRGAVDKFIGDGLMAVFGLEDEGTAASDAVRAACAMLDAVEALNSQLSAPIRIGIGIHQGEVIAGTIGAPSRLEFTCVGDAVNVAARLEGLTKELDSPIAISGAVHESLTGEVAGWRWIPCGEQAVKGRSSVVAVFTLATAKPEALAS